MCVKPLYAYIRTYICMYVCTYNYVCVHMYICIVFIRVESGSDDPENVGHLFEGSSGSHP